MHSKKSLIKSLTQSISYLFLLSALLTSSVYALDVDASYGERRGEVIYQIGGKLTLDPGVSGNVRFPLSELRFQLNTPIMNLQFNQAFKNDWLILISATKNVTSNSGEMQDSDWGLNYYLINPRAFPRDSLDIYSESRLSLNAMDLQIELRKKIEVADISLWRIFIGAGILFQRYQFEAFDTIQHYPSTPEIPAVVLKGKNLTYRYRASMPFASANVTRNMTPKTAVAIAALYSPWLKVTDYDDHILRNKTSTGKSNGWGVKLSVSLSYAMWHSTNVYLTATYLKTLANGTQTQSASSDEKISSADIGLRNINKQRNMAVGFSHVF